MTDMQCAAISFKTEDKDGNLSSLLIGSEADVLLSSDSETARFFYQDGCFSEQATSKIGLDDKADQHTFYFRESKKGSTEITVTVGDVSARQTQTIDYSIYGTWISSCYLTAGDTNYSKTTDTFNEDLSFSSITLKYNDSTCTTSTEIAQSITGTYVIGTMNTGTDSRAIDLTTGDTTTFDVYRVDGANLYRGGSQQSESARPSGVQAAFDNSGSNRNSLTKV